MNERIRELAKEAQKAVDARWEKEGYPPYPEAHRIFIEERDKKFAELIVKECADVAVNADSGRFYTADAAGYVGLGRQTASKLIKQHFGVEE